jgi:Ser/Thr protein kinase RdoA (MazF antagonist)
VVAGSTNETEIIESHRFSFLVDGAMACRASAGIDAGAITFEGQLARLRTIAERCDLIGLKPGLAWLDDHRPPKAREAAICHGDFHPLNILADKNQPTGVIDWTSAVIAEAAMDVGSAIANMSAVPLPLPWALRVAARRVIGAALRRYERTYRALRPLDDRAVLYYQVFRARRPARYGRSGQGHRACGRRCLSFGSRRRQPDRSHQEAERCIGSARGACASAWNKLIGSR